jgi:hypothetical protein
MDIIGTRVFSIQRFVLALVDHYRFLALCNDKTMIGFGNADGMLHRCAAMGKYCKDR